MCIRDRGKQMIMSGGLGTMGYGLPGGIGAKIGNPDRPVIVISGDGGVQMNIQELATAVLEELPVIPVSYTHLIVLPAKGASIVRAPIRYRELTGVLCFG